jgi:hypothetical protein
MQAPIQQTTADVGAVSSVGVAAVTWITELNAFLQLGATAVAIVAGLAAAWYHIEKAWTAREERKNGEDIR